MCVCTSESLLRVFGSKCMVWLHLRGTSRRHSRVLALQDFHNSLVGLCLHLCLTCIVLHVVKGFSLPSAVVCPLAWCSLVLQASDL